MSRRYGSIVCIVVSVSAGMCRADDTVCDAEAFRSVVSSASTRLAWLRDQNGKALHEKLLALRSRFDWTEDEFLIKAAPIVKDETTASLDRANEALLTKVQSLDGAAAATEAGRCAMLAELRQSMDQVIANTAAKWEHILAKASDAGTGSQRADLGR